MSNASTIRRQVAGTQQLTLASISVATAATETAFALNNDALTLSGGGLVPLVAGVTGLYQGTGQVLWIHAAGTLVGGTATGTLVLKLYEVPASAIAAGISTTSPFSGTLIATSATGTLAAGETAGSFTVDAYIQLDAQGNLTGTYQSQVFGSATGAKTAITLVSGLVGEADLNFLLSATSAVETTGTITLDEFSLNFV